MTTMFYEYRKWKRKLLLCVWIQTPWFPLHIHQVIELVHVIQGEIVMQIGPKTYTLKPGNLAIIFPNVVHNYHTLSEYGETLFYVLNCNPNLLPYFQKDLLKGQPANPVLNPNQIHTDFLYAEKRSVEVHFCPETVPLCSSLVSLMLSRILSIFKNIALWVRSSRTTRPFRKNNFLYWYSFLLKTFHRKCCKSLRNWRVCTLKDIQQCTSSKL